MRNFVAKHDYHHASAHKDKKNDYTRSWRLQDEDEINDAGAIEPVFPDESEED